MSTHIVLVADDLTGALDSVVPFAERGLSTRVAVDIAHIDAALADNPDVLAINTQSRSAPATIATARIAALWDRIAPFSPSLVFKKVDSRLKGQVPAEITALLHASGRREVLACPAAVSLGRVVLAGHVQGHGIDQPISVAERLGVCDFPCQIRDAQSWEDMRDIARTALTYPSRTLVVGARDLAAAIAERTMASTPSAPARALRPTLPMIVSIGSRDPITQTQIQHLQAHCPDLLDCPSPDGMVPPPIGRIEAPVILIRATKGRGSPAPEVVAQRLAMGVIQMAAEQQPRTILACGGDTAYALAEALGQGVLAPCHELLPGVPFSHFADHRGMAFIAKSGGFGLPDALSAIVSLTRNATPRIAPAPVQAAR